MITKYRHHSALPNLTDSENRNIFIVRRWLPKGRSTNQFLGDNRDMEPPESISNSEVKRVIADDSVGLPHVKVGHHQVNILKPCSFGQGFFMPDS